MKHYFVVLVLAVVSVSGCRNRDKVEPTEPQLPPETQQGLNTFGCKINGKVFVPKGGNDFPPVFADVFPDYFQITGSTTGTEKDVIVILLMTNWPQTIGTFELGAATCMECDYNNGLVDVGSSNVTECSTRTSEIFGGKIEIKYLNFEDGIVSGKFEFTSVSECDTFIVTEGRFDVHDS